MSPLATSTPLGAFTNQTVAAINSALAQAGLAATTGNVFYCDPVNGLDTNDGQTPATTPGGHGPVQTLQAGYNLLRSGYNDVLVLIGNGASTGSARLSATFTWAKNAAHLIGVCAPSAISQRARIAPTLNIAGFANFFVVSGNGCLFQNLSWFHGFNVGVAAEICLTVSGERNAFVNCDIEGMGDTSAGAGAADTGSRCILLTGGGENFFKHCNVGLDTVTRTNANFTVELKAGSPRNRFEDCTFLMYSGDGAQFVLSTAAAASFDRWVLFRNCIFINAVGSAATACNGVFKLTAASGGLVILCGCTSVGFTYQADNDATTEALVYMGMAAPSQVGLKGVTASS